MSLPGLPFIKRKQRYILLNIVIAALLSLFLVKNVVSGCRIEGNSMCPTLSSGDKLLISHINSEPEQIERFDIVVFKRTGNSTLVKRVIALPGETLKLKSGSILINNRPVTPPPFLKGNLLSEQQQEIRIPEGSFFLMGDNRRYSFDSRNFGPVHHSSIIGKALMRYWPPHKIGSVK